MHNNYRSITAIVRSSRHLPLLLGAFALAACGVVGRDKPSATPVVGDRVSILGASRVVEADPAIADVPVVLPDPIRNADWAQPGGAPSKDIGHVALSETPSRVWMASIHGGGKKTRLASSPIISGGTLYVIDTDASVHAFDAKTGARGWSTAVRDRDDQISVEFGGGVSAAGDRLFVTTGIGDVAALEAATGKIIWKVRPGGPLRGSATLNNGHAYVMSQDNQIFALSQDDGSVVWSESGTVGATAIFGVSAPAAVQGTVVAGFSSGELSAYRYENGRVLWGDALSRTSISTTVAALTDIDADPMIDRGRVFAIGQGGRMASYELVSGQRLWELNIAGVATPAVVGDWVFVVTDTSQLLCVARADGRIRWISQLDRWRKPKKKTGTIRWHGPTLAGNRLILVSTDGKMVLVDPADGTVRTTHKIGHPMSLVPVVADNMLYILTDDGDLLAFR